MAAQSSGPFESYKPVELDDIRPESVDFANETAVADVVKIASTHPGMQATMAFVNWMQKNPYFTVVEYKRDEDGLYYDRPDGTRAPLE